MEVSRSFGVDLLCLGALRRLTSMESLDERGFGLLSTGTISGESIDSSSLDGVALFAGVVP